MSEEEVLERLARIESILSDLSPESPVSAEVESRLAEIESRLGSIEKALEEGLDYVI
jgi:hypothetical protein